MATEPNPDISQEAAQELLAVLRDFATLPDETPPPGILGLAWRQTLAAARAAIAKAEGRA
jgi:hypothetical protein